MACPHAQFRSQSNRFAACEPLAIYVTSAAECAECDLLLRVVEEYKPGWIKENNNGRAAISVVHKAGNKYDVPATVNLLVGSPYEGENGSNDPELVDSFQYFRPSKEEPMYEKVSRPFSKAVLHQTLDVISNSLTQPAFDRAAKWLSYCTDHDKGCKTPNSDFMPLRLLNVSPLDGTRDAFLFEPTETAPYVCLSYCWGISTNNVLQTTKGNLDSHFHSIPFSLLPQTIYHAIILCRNLGVHNLWVDSLCIVQDDSDDWLQNSAQMREIYLNSFFTIAAEEPASCKLGFLGKQRFGNSEWQRRFTTNVPVEVGGPGKEVFIRPKGVGFQEQHERCSLDKRGWCLQETILPNRRVCFNGDEMTWECRSRKICECGHTLWAPQSARYETLGASVKSGSGRPYEDWRALIEEYSDRSLTHKTDKLSAISGLAKMIVGKLRNAEGTFDTYLAGLWKREFLSDLTWRVVSFEPESQGTQQYRAPSWSWASVDGSVRYEFRKRVSLWKYTPKQEAHTSVDEVICHSVLPSDPTGPVTAAYAILTGFLVPVELAVLDEALSEEWQYDFQRDPVIPIASKHRSLVRSNNLWSLEVFLDCPWEVTLKTGAVQADCWMQGKCVRKCCVWESQGLADYLEGKRTHLYCLGLFTWRATGNFDNSGKRRLLAPETWFLVLRRSSTTEGAFERIGVGVWRSNSDLRLWDRGDNCPLFEGCESVTITIV